ncbi:Predicted gene 5114 [Apodemus speciosus]|uniref:Predicted gene 5114 n=1 Tax=Apodemus speciosus TaxID=105296 RepID=A0ABQ0EY42_APOSI
MTSGLCLILDTLVGLVSVSYKDYYLSGSIVGWSTVTPPTEPPNHVRENFQNSPFFGTERALQPSLPLLSNSTQSAGRVCNYSRVSTPDVSSAWLLPSASSTSLQPLMGNTYLNPHAGTTMLTVLTEQGQISTSAPSYPGALKWDFTGSTDRRENALQEFNVTIIDQDTTLSSLAMTNQCEKILDPNAIVPFYPTLPAGFVQVTPPQMPNQGYSLAPSYQEGSQVYYYEHNSLGPLIAGEFGQCLQAHGSVSYPGSQTSALQPEMVMVLKEIQPRNVQIPLYTSAFSYSTSAQSMADNNLPVVQMETSLGLPPSGLTQCQLQSPELCNTCTQVSQIGPPAVNGDRALTAPIHSPSEFLALPPPPSLEQTENKNMAEIKDEFLKTLDAHEGTKENQDTPIMTLEQPDSQQPLHCPDTESLRQKPASDNAHLGGISMGPKELGGLENEIGSSFDFKDITTLEADIQLPQLLNTLTDIDQDQSCENWRVISGPSDQVRKNKHKSSELLEGAPQAKLQHRDLVEERGLCVFLGPVTGLMKPWPNTWRAKLPNGPENNSKKTEELKQSRNRVKAEEKPTVPKTKRKRNPPELSQNNFKKPRTHLGMHMLDPCRSSTLWGRRVRRKLASNKDPGPRPVTTTMLNRPCEGQGPPKSPGKVQRAESSADKECPSPSQYELPPAGKVRLVPLPFPSLDKPQSRPASRKPPSLALRRPAAAYPVQPHSHSGQPTTLRPTQSAPVSTSLMAPAKPAPSISSSATQPNVANPIQSSAAPQVATSRPAPCRASSHTSFQRELVSAARNKVPSPPKPQTQYLLQDFSRQPIPWKKVDILGPVVSQPITKEQRPEREAMKRRAQQERENAAKNSSSGKLQLFLQREKDMEISQYYGYAM